MSPKFVDLRREIIIPNIFFHVNESSYETNFFNWNGEFPNNISKIATKKFFVLIIVILTDKEIRSNYKSRTNK